jgi:hypothetical protein
MPNAQKGMVLFTSMVMLAILSMLILSLMQAIFLYIKASSQLANQHQAFYQLEAVAAQLQLSNFSELDTQCMVQEKNPNEVIDRLKHHHGCKQIEGEKSYRYLISDLGDYPCLQVESEGNRLGSHHWLITVENQEAPFELLQLRMANPINSIQCEGTPTVINAGVVSWRHFNSFYKN